MIIMGKKKIQSMSGRHYKWVRTPTKKSGKVHVTPEKKKKLLKLLKSAEENHAKAGTNIKRLRSALKHKGYL